MIKVKFIENARHIDVNNCNITSLAPFRIVPSNEEKKCDLLCKSSFYSDIHGTSVEKILLQDFNIIVDEKIDELPIEKNDNFWKVYDAMFNWMSIENWYHILDEKTALIKLTPQECTFLINGTKDEQFVNKLNVAMKDIRPTFAKLEVCSVKQDFAPYEIYNGNDLIEQISKSSRCIKQLKSPYRKDHYLFLRKWRENIKHENEFRVFIDNGKISGISQQFLYDVFIILICALSSKAEQIFLAVQKLWDSISPKLEYKTCVLDVYIEFNDQDEFICYLIEINGCGRWGAAGSSLYNWITDDPLMNELELRISV